LGPEREDVFGGEFFGPYGFFVHARQALAELRGLQPLPAWEGETQLHEV
jgi:hypothetical protein